MDRKEYQRKYRQSLNGYLRRIFHHIKDRCKDSDDEHYGGRGIKCLFKSVNEFMDYVVNELQIDPRGLQIDRINNDGHYERGNIQFTEQFNNTRKRRKFIKRKCTSKFKGVSWCKARKNWQAHAKIKTNIKQSTYLGSFKCESDAAMAYDEAALKYFGEFALTNKMLGLYENNP